MRDVTHNLQEGLGRIRWTDNEATVKEQYPIHRSSQAYEGRDPQSGEVVRVGPGLVLETFDRVDDHVQLFAVVYFDAKGVEQISLNAEPATQTSETPDNWPELLTTAAQKLGERLGFGPVDADAMEQEWTVQNVRVSLFQDGSEFNVSLERLR